MRQGFYGKTRRFLRLMMADFLPFCGRFAQGADFRDERNVGPEKFEMKRTRVCFRTFGFIYIIRSMNALGTGGWGIEGAPRPAASRLAGRGAAMQGVAGPGG